MKKIISTLLAAAMLVSMAACTSDTSNEGGTSSSVSDTSAQGSSEAEGGASADGEEAEKPLLSNKIPLTEDGDIDMTAALAYQTDYEAFKAAVEAKTVDATKPVSENSNEDTLEVFNYLRSIYGKQILTCQQMMNADAPEDLVYYNATGDLPAMKGFDFIFSTGDYVDDGMVTEAIRWHEESGGLVTFTWHWNVPCNVDDPTGPHAFYTEEITNWSAINAVTPGTKEYEIVIHDIDLIATKLQRMESEGITVLFRPLHEASGAWFWWGIQGKETVQNEVFQKLWYMIYDRLENHHKLTNLIWVWNGQHKHCAVSPNTYDIAGTDYYANEPDHTAMRPQYDSLSNLVGDSGKMLALSECGYIPDPADCAATDTMWLYYMIWNGDFVYEVDAGGNIRTNLDGTPYPNTARMTNEMLVEYFSNETFITHSDLPEFRTGTKAIPQKIVNWEYFKIA